MSQQQWFVGSGNPPASPNVQFIQGDDAVPVGPNPTTHVINVLGDATKGVSTSNTAPYTETITVAFATTSTPGVASFDPNDFSVVNGLVSLAGVEGFKWNVVTSAMNPITIMEDNGYICNGGTPIAFVLPPTPTIGRGFTIISNQTTFSITENVLQQMFVGTKSSTAATGSLVSGALGDQAAFIYMGLNIFRAFAPQGNLVLT